MHFRSFPPPLPSPHILKCSNCISKYVLRETWKMKIAFFFSFKRCCTKRMKNTTQKKELFCWTWCIRFSAVFSSIQRILFLPTLRFELTNKKNLSHERNEAHTQTQASWTQKGNISLWVFQWIFQRFPFSSQSLLILPKTFPFSLLSDLEPFGWKKFALWLIFISHKTVKSERKKARRKKKLYMSLYN